MGSRRTTPTLPVAAAVVSEATDAPTSTPCDQSRASYTSGASSRRRPPKISAEIGTPRGSAAAGLYAGLSDAATVKRELGCAAGPLAGSYGRPTQSVTGRPSVRPSHHGSLSAVSATLVNSVSRRIMRSALRLVLALVPGTTPK